MPPTDFKKVKYELISGFGYLVYIEPIPIKALKLLTVYSVSISQQLIAVFPIALLRIVQ